MKEENIRELINYIPTRKAVEYCVNHGLCDGACLTCFNNCNEMIFEDVTKGEE